MIKNVLISFLLFLLETIIYNATCNESKYPPVRNYIEFEEQKEASELEKKISKFINTCKNNILLDENVYPLSNHPKISLTIPLYNGAEFIYYCIRSIQNQSLKDIEIIVIDDKSTDNSTLIISEFQKTDPRIRLFINEKNMGILYSKSYAALQANGEYIIQVDQDDVFLNENVLEYLYSYAKENKLDAIKYSYIIFGDFLNITNEVRSYTESNSINYNKFTQPYLSDYMFFNESNKFQPHVELLWNKMINTKSYQNAVKRLGYDIYSTKVLQHEDYIVITEIFQELKNIKFIKYLGYGHFNNTKSAGFHRFGNTNQRDQSAFDYIYHQYYIYNLTAKNIYKKKKYHKVLYFIVNWKFNYILENAQIKNLNLQKKLYDKYLNNKNLMKYKYLKKIIKKRKAKVIKKIKDILDMNENYKNQIKYSNTTCRNNILNILTHFKYITI